MPLTGIAGVSLIEKKCTKQPLPQYNWAASDI